MRGVHNKRKSEKERKREREKAEGEKERERTYYNFEEAAYIALVRNKRWKE